MLPYEVKIILYRRLRNKAILVAQLAKQQKCNIIEIWLNFEDVNKQVSVFKFEVPFDMVHIEFASAWDISRDVRCDVLRRLEETLRRHNHLMDCTLIIECSVKNE